MNSQFVPDSLSFETTRAAVNRQNAERRQLKEQADDFKYHGHLPEPDEQI